MAEVERQLQAGEAKIAKASPAGDLYYEDLIRSCVGAPDSHQHH